MVTPIFIVALFLPYFLALGFYFRKKKDGKKLTHNSKYNNRSVKRVFSAGLKTLCIHQVHDDERSIHHFQHGLPGL